MEISSFFVHSRLAIAFVETSDASRPAWIKKMLVRHSIHVSDSPSRGGKGSSTCRYLFERLLLFVGVPCVSPVVDDVALPALPASSTCGATRDRSFR
jgi:hypothetical protein